MKWECNKHLPAESGRGGGGSSPYQALKVPLFSVISGHMGRKLQVTRHTKQPHDTSPVLIVRLDRLHTVLFVGEPTPHPKHSLEGNRAGGSPPMSYSEPGACSGYGCYTSSAGPAARKWVDTNPPCPRTPASCAATRVNTGRLHQGNHSMLTHRLAALLSLWFLC